MSNKINLNDNHNDEIIINDDDNDVHDKVTKNTTKIIEESEDETDKIIDNNSENKSKLDEPLNPIILQPEVDNNSARRNTLHNYFSAELEEMFDNLDDEHTNYIDLTTKDTFNWKYIRGKIKQLPEDSKTQKNICKILIRYMNRYFGLIKSHSKTGILFVEKTYNEETKSIEILEYGRDQFFCLFSNKKVYINSKKPAYVEIGKLFYTSDYRRDYERKVYNPSYIQKFSKDDYHPKFNVLNVYSGMRWTDEECKLVYDTNPKAIANMELFRKHLYEILCWEKKEFYEFVENWFSFKFKYPWKKYANMPIFIGVQGSGKGIFIDAMLKIFGKNGDKTARVGDVVGQFNSILENKLILFLDEFALPENKKARSTIFAMISEDTISLEKKYSDRATINSYCSFLAASNYVSPVVLDQNNNRRWAIIQTNPKYAIEKSSDAKNKLQHNYFDKLSAAIECDDNAMLKCYYHYLKHIHQLGDFTKGKVAPISEYQKALHSSQLKSFARWLQTILLRGYNVHPDKLDDQNTNLSIFINTDGRKLINNNDESMKITSNYFSNNYYKQYLDYENNNEEYCDYSFDDDESQLFLKTARSIKDPNTQNAIDSLWVREISKEELFNCYKNYCIKNKNAIEFNINLFYQQLSNVFNSLVKTVDYNTEELKINNSKDDKLLLINSNINKSSEDDDDVIHDDNMNINNSIVDDIENEFEQQLNEEHMKKIQNKISVMDLNDDPLKFPIIHNVLLLNGIERKQKYVILPSLDQARKEFEKYYGISLENDDESETMKKSSDKLTRFNFKKNMISDHNKSSNYRNNNNNNNNNNYNSNYEDYDDKYTRSGNYVPPKKRNDQYHYDNINRNSYEDYPSDDNGQYFTPPIINNVDKYNRNSSMDEHFKVPSRRISNSRNNNIQLSHHNNNNNYISNNTPIKGTIKFTKDGSIINDDDEYDESYNNNNVKKRKNIFFQKQPQQFGLKRNKVNPNVNVTKKSLVIDLSSDIPSKTLTLTPNIGPKTMEAIKTLNTNIKSLDSSNKLDWKKIAQSIQRDNK